MAFSIHPTSGTGDLQQGPNAGMASCFFQLCACGLFLVSTLRKLLDNFRAKGREIVRITAGYQALVDNDFLIDPCTAGIPDVGLQAGIGCQRAPFQDIGLDQRPWCMAYRGHRFFLPEKVMNERDDFF